MDFTMIRNVSLFILLILTGRAKLESKDETRPYLAYVNEIVKTCAAEIEKEFDIDYVGNGGSMPNDVEKIDVVFTGSRRASLEEAREIEVRAIEKLLHAINNHEKIRPFLREYPFTAKGVGVSLSFENPWHYHYSDGTIAHMFSTKDKIFYDINDPITERLVDYLEEPFEVAQKIVHEHPLNRDLRIHKPTPYEEHVDQLFLTFAKQMQKKWKLIVFEMGGKLANGIEEFGVNFYSFQKGTIEKAREMEIDATEKLLQLINSDPVIRPYLKEYPFTADRAKIIIQFKKDADRDYWDGSVVNVRQVDHKLLYLARLPPRKDGGVTCDPVPLAEETYEEAKENLRKEKVKKSTL